MPTKLAILGLLMDRPMYGYDIKKIMEEKMSHYADISFSSIYFVLDSLEKKGDLKKIKKQEGNRPAKNVYHITEEGKKEFCRLLEENLSSTKRVYDPFNVGIVFMGRLGRKNALEFLEKKKEDNERVLQILRQVCKKHVKTKFEGVLLNRGIAHFEADQKWIAKTMRDI